MKVISSPDNKLIKLASSLKYRKYRDAKGLFFIEGFREAEEALKRPELVQTVFWDQSWTEDNPLYAAAAGFPDSYCLEHRLMKRICSTENPQGIAAIVKKPVWSWEAVLAAGGLLILLDQVSDPGNAGSILRTCWAFGAGGVLMTGGSVDPFSPKVVRSTMGAILNVPVFTDVSEEQLDILEQRSYSFMSTDIAGSQPYYKIKYDSHSVIIFGSEARGVSPELKKRCRRFINIPMDPGVDSLNVASACAIIVAEARRQHQEGAEMA